MKAEIITIGDEILIGQIVDTNSAWIAARLNEAGFTVVRKLTVGDDRREIADAVEGAMRTADAVMAVLDLGVARVARRLISDGLGLIVEARLDALEAGLGINQEL